MKSPWRHDGEPQVRRSQRLRRILSEARGTPLIVGSLSLNFQSCHLLVGERIVILTPAEFELLYYLMSRAGEVLSAEQILSQVWQYPPGTGRPELIRAHIKNLRYKIERNSREPEYLRTIGHRGYMICNNDPSKA